jgi:hypothetical protein
MPPGNGGVVKSLAGLTGLAVGNAGSPEAGGVAGLYK